MDKKQTGVDIPVPKEKNKNPAPSQNRKAAGSRQNGRTNDPVRPSRASSTKMHDTEDDLFHTLEYHVKETNSTPTKENAPNIKPESVRENAGYKETAERIREQSKAKDTIRAQEIPLEEPPKQKFMTGLLAIFLGYTGIHWFYQKKYLRGAAYLAVFFLLSNLNESLISAAVIFCLAEGVFIIASSPDAFLRYYHKHMKTFAFWCCLVISIAIFCWIDPASTPDVEYSEIITSPTASETETTVSDHWQQLTIVTESVPVSTAELTTAPPVSKETQLPALLNHFYPVITGIQKFVLSDTQESLPLFGISKLMGFDFESYLTPTSFCVVDMDQDGTNEIIVGIDTDVDGFRLVLRYQDGIVYGYPFGFRGLKTVSTDGLITGSSSAFESSITRLSFNSLTIDYYDLTDVEEQIALASWQDATWYEFTEENVGKFFPNMDISFTLPSAPPPSTTVQQNETVETYSTGYVMYGTGGLNIRNGPGVGYDQIGRLLEGEQVVILETTYSGTARWGRIERGWVSMDYIQMGEVTASNVNASSMYALDYINGTTGSVLNRIGRNYIMGSGFSGSQLFYYGSNTNMQFGFVPNDWTNPSISGNEPISVILVSGNARISTSLSADMNKAQLDAAAWNTPNVINVSGQYTYGEMWGSVYMYEIETTSARILYMWYLDDGDNIDYPAGEITISPK